MNPEVQETPRIVARKARIFTKCFEQVRDGQTSIEDCVAKHPRFTDLGDLLHLAEALRRFPSEGPDPIRFTKLREQFVAQFAGRNPQEPTP